MSASPRDHVWVQLQSAEARSQRAEVQSAAGQEACSLYSKCINIDKCLNCTEFQNTLCSQQQTCRVWSNQMNNSWEMWITDRQTDSLHYKCHIHKSKLKKETSTYTRFFSFLSLKVFLIFKKSTCLMFLSFLYISLDDVLLIFCVFRLTFWFLAVWIRSVLPEQTESSHSVFLSWATWKQKQNNTGASLQ